MSAVAQRSNSTDNDTASDIIQILYRTDSESSRNENLAPMNGQQFGKCRSKRLLYCTVSYKSRSHKIFYCRIDNTVLYSLSYYIQYSRKSEVFICVLYSTVMQCDMICDR